MDTTSELPAPAVETTVRAQLHAAVTVLAARCDGANTSDGTGFNKFDADAGHALAADVAAGKEPNLLYLYRVVSKYRHQLATLGLELPTVEAAEGACASQRIAQPTAPAAIVGLHVTTDPMRPHLYVVKFAYDPQLVGVVKMLPGRRWEPIAKCWTIPRSTLPALLQKVPTAVLAPEIVAAQDTAAASRLVQETTRADMTARALSRLEDIIPTLSRTLFEHQLVGARWLIEARQCILADDMGLGKTMLALVAARALALRTVVIGPAGLRSVWTREASVVCQPLEYHSWAAIPEPWDPAVMRRGYVLIVDEAHYGQTWTSKRTQKMIRLAQGAEAVFLLSGTPVKNGRPANLYPLLFAIGHELARDKRGYERRYCAATATRWTKWDITGAAHLEELHVKIADRLLRRTKGDCLDLPAKVRVVRTVELSSEAQARYHETFQALRQEYHRRVAAGEIGEAEALTMLTAARHATSVAKVEGSIEIAEEVVESGGQVGIHVLFKDAAAMLARALGAVTVTGDDSQAERDNAVRAFQAGECKIIVFTSAGGLGITLTAGKTVIMHDRPWTPGDALQAEDRFHRIGQTGSVLAIWPRANGTDRWLDSILCDKHTRAGVIVDGEATLLPFEDVEQLTDGSMREVARRIFG